MSGRTATPAGRADRRGSMMARSIETGAGSSTGKRARAVSFPSNAAGQDRGPGAMTSVPPPSETKASRRSQNPSGSNSGGTSPRMITSKSSNGSIESDPGSGLGGSSAEKVASEAPEAGGGARRTGRRSTRRSRSRAARR